MENTEGTEVAGVNIVAPSLESLCEFYPYLSWNENIFFCFP